MRVRIHNLEMFESGQLEDYHQLQRLFLRAAQGQHELDVSEPERVLSSHFWQVATSEMDRIEWEELLTRTLAAPMFAPAEQEPRYALVESEPSQSPGGPRAFVLQPHQVGAWAEQPLRVLLENARDAILVRMAARFGESERLRESLDRGWLQPEGRGGCGEVKNALNQAGYIHRLFVILDSDREEPEGEASKTARDICELCESLPHVYVHVLNRRELENYIPEALWELVISKQPKKRSRSQANAQRTVLVYRWLLRLIEQDERAAGKYGQQVLQNVVTELQRKAERPLPGKLQQQLLAEWKTLSLEARWVDDLKVRFGERLAQEALQELDGQGFDESWLDAACIKELREIARELEEWL